MGTLRSVTFDIEGLHCGACVGRAERALGAVPGVGQAHVNLALETAVVEIADDSDLAALEEAAQAAGYPISPRHDLAETADLRQDDAWHALRRSFLVAALLSAPVVVIEMGGHLFPAFHHWVHGLIGRQGSGLIQFVLTTLVLLWPGRQFFARGFPALMRSAPDMNSLVALGTAAAWVFSTVSLFAPGILPAGSAAFYFEAAAVIVTLILAGRMMEARAKGRTGDAIRKLVGLRPATALVETPEGPRDVPVAQVAAGDVIQVRPGDRIAVDGTVIDGSSHVDESMLTGEPMPALRGPGTQVSGGTVNGTGAFRMRADAVGADMVLSRIIRMVEEAQGARLPIQDLVNRVTFYFVPIVMAIAALTVLVWLLLGPSPALGHALVAGVSVLIIACPCAMGLATPTSIMVGTGRAAEMGVLFRAGDALQKLQGVDVVAFDKTGTLTLGAPALTDVVVSGGWDDAEMLALAAAVEAQSEHPVARAIEAGAAARGIAIETARDFASFTGKGAEARVKGQHVQVGSPRWLRAEGIDMTSIEQSAEQLAAGGKTAVYVAVDGEVAGIVAVADPIRDGAAEAVAELQAQGCEVVMVSGDARSTAEAIAAELGIARVVAEVLPEGKADAVRSLQADGRKVAFIGDGINDAPALATADVGLAVGTGTDVAIEAADVVLMSGAPDAVLRALRISRATMSNIRQNLIWAFGYNVLLIPVAAGLLYPLWGTLLSPMLAAGAMALSSVFVVSNALRLRLVRA